MHQSTISGIASSIADAFDARDAFSSPIVEAWALDGGEDTTDYTPDTGPTPWTELEWLGFRLGLEGSDGQPTRDVVDMVNLTAFYRGKLAGEIESQMGADAELEDWLDRLDAIHEAGRDHCEEIEAIGVVECRKGVA